MKRVVLILAVVWLGLARDKCPVYYCVQNPDPSNKCIVEARRGNYHIHPPADGFECHIPSKVEKREFPAIKKSISQEIPERSLLPGEVATSPLQCISGKIQYTDQKAICRSERPQDCEEPQCLNFVCRYSRECDVGYHCAVADNQKRGRCSQNKEIGQNCSVSSKCQPWANCDDNKCVEVFSKEAGEQVSSLENKMLCKSMYIIQRQDGTLECAKQGPKLKYTADVCDLDRTIVDQLEYDKQRMRQHPGDDCVYQAIDHNGQIVEITTQAECSWSQSGKAFCPILEGDSEIACRLPYV